MATRRIAIYLGLAALVLAASGAAVLLLKAPQLVPPSTAEVEAVREQILRDQPPARGATSVSIDAIETHGQWSLVTMHPITGVDEGIEGIVVIGRFEGGRWAFATQGEDLFAAWLELLPPELLPEEAKDALR